jgi:hypothetical protein
MGPNSKVTVVSWGMVMVPVVVVVVVAIEQIRRAMAEWDIWAGVGLQMDIKRRWSSQAANFRQQQLGVWVPELHH